MWSLECSREGTALRIIRYTNEILVDTARNDYNDRQLPLDGKLNHLALYCFVLSPEELLSPGLRNLVQLSSPL